MDDKTDLSRKFTTSSCCDLSQTETARYFVFMANKNTGLYYATYFDIIQISIP